jgi:hypothetical protein
LGTATCNNHASNFWIYIRQKLPFERLEPGDRKPPVGKISRCPVIPRFGFMLYEDNALTHL